MATSTYVCSSHTPFMTGGNGEVYRAKHMASGTSVVLKRMERVLSDVQWRRDICYLKAIQHPHIVEVLDVLYSKKEVWLVMEDAQGGDLFELMSRLETANISLTEAQIYGMFVQLLSALTALHRHGIAHRDLKLENVLLRAPWTPLVCSASVVPDGNHDHKPSSSPLANADASDHKPSSFVPEASRTVPHVLLCDFGLASMSARSQTCGGTSKYLAPEVFEPQTPYHPPTVDIWGLGNILFLLAHGHEPFPCIRSHKGMSSRLSKQYVRCKCSVRSDAFCDLIHQMLESCPNKRITIEEIWKHPWMQQYTLDTEQWMVSPKPQELPSVPSPLPLTLSLTSFRFLQIDLASCLSSSPSSVNPSSSSANVCQDQRPSPCPSPKSISSSRDSDSPTPLSRSNSSDMEANDECDRLKAAKAFVRMHPLLHQTIQKYIARDVQGLFSLHQPNEASVWMFDRLFSRYALTAYDSYLEQIVLG